MRQFVLFIALLPVFSVPAAAQKKVNDEAAIRAAIENESRYFWARDLKNWKKQWVHENYVIWRAASRDGVTQYQSWDAWNKHVESFFAESPEAIPYTGHVEKRNYVFRIYGSGAWVSFEQVNNGVITYETRVMEKVKGDWRIAMVELIFNANEKITQDSGGN